MTRPDFIPNTPDNNHCLQAAILMALRSIGIESSLKEVDRITRYDKRLYSWASVAAKELHKMIPGLRLYSPFDQAKFAKGGEIYYRKVASRKWFMLQKKHASKGFQKEQEAAAYLIKNNLFKKKLLKSADLSRLLKNDLLIVLVDPYILEDLKGSAGHFVLMYASTRSHFIVHDPGLPPRKSWKVSRRKFMRAFKHSVLAIPRAL